MQMMEDMTDLHAWIRYPDALGKRRVAYKSTINGFVVDDTLNDPKNALELLPHHVDPLVVLQALFSSNGGPAD